ncbi:pyruvate dehydrogenase E1 component beta subunit [Limimonas halophila]|uniref:Pyruvate dehydrogenase E1 component subunit beta n=1 Tax=Limimonas halophila TaxID=1082479 RepID=A0A1G7NBQ7_9PROT|nr:pyruvate dehydrogenase complex E1 component subunit beta [Limimonas halophila]SDF71396.1 pyruvate dehydrogenase E1 component beta subunit [Limimonas halophila]
MPIEVLMPALSPTMTEGTLARWHKQEGDTVNNGDVLAEIETDKATMEVEAVDEGTLGRILVEGGTESVPVNAPIAILLGEGDSEADLDAAERAARAKLGGESAPAEASAEEAPAPEPAASSGPSTGDGATSAPPPATAREHVPKGIYDADGNLRLGATVDEQYRTSFADYVEEQAWTGPTKNQTVREALRDAMAEEMRSDDRVYLMGEEVADYEGAYKVTVGMLDEFGRRRVVDTPITEHGFAGVGIGAAFYGLRPIVEFMTWNFAMQAMDQIINSAGKKLYMSGGQINCPIVFRGPNGPASRVAAQHSQEYANWYGNVPGLKVVSPYHGADYKGLLKAAIRDPNPVVFLENELVYGETFEIPDTDDWTVPIGKAKVRREGSDVTIVAHSVMVGRALQAAEQLASEEGIQAEVVDMRTIRPFDADTLLASVKKTNRVVACEEGWPFAGTAAEMSAICMEHAFDYLDAPVLRVCSKDVPQPYAANLEKLAVPSVADVATAAKRVCYRA